MHCRYHTHRLPKPLTFAPPPPSSPPRPHQERLHARGGGGGAAGEPGEPPGCVAAAGCPPWLALPPPPPLPLLFGRGAAGCGAALDAALQTLCRSGAAILHSRGSKEPSMCPSVTCWTPPLLSLWLTRLRHPCLPLCAVGVRVRPRRQRGHWCGGGGLRHARQACQLYR